jgi:hypothetical protein
LPPLQKKTPFKRKNITKSFFNLDLSDKPLTTSKIPKPRNYNYLITSKPPAINKAKGNNKAALLTLPIEIRFRIYNLQSLSLSSRFLSESHQKLMGTPTYFGPILVGNYIK